VEVANLDLEIGVVLGQVLGHALGQGGDQHPLAAVDARADLAEEVVDLVAHRPDLDLGIEQSGRAQDLLHDHAARLLQLVLGRGGRHEDELAHARLPLVEAERAVVDRAGQAEAVFDQVLLARAVAAEHRLDLRDGLVRLVDEHQAVVGEIVDERRGRLARLASGQVARVVLDARAEAHLLEALDVVERALLQALALDQAVAGGQLGQALLELDLDALDRAPQVVRGRHVVRGGEHRRLGDLALHLAAQRIDLAHALDLIAPPLDANSGVRLVGRKDLDRVAAHAEGAAVEVDVVALVLHLDEAAEDVVARALGADRDLAGHLPVELARADAVDAGDRGDDDDVAPRQERVGRRVAHAVDLFVDERVLLDVRVGGRDVGLRLVVVVVADEVVDRVVGEELLELAVELGGQGLVVGDDERGTAELGDDVGDREGLARPGDAEQRLPPVSAAHALDELADGVRLIAGRLELGVQLEETLLRGSLGHTAGELS
jgi:hypothetical protein